MTPLAALPATDAPLRPLKGRSDRRASEYTPLPRALLRAPLLPIEAYHEISAASPADRRRRALEDPRIHEALAVGAADLLAALERPTLNARDARRVDRSLMRYLIRMSTRPTPFGLFAGVAIARWGSTTDVILDARDRDRRIRFDMEWLSAWVTRVEARAGVRGHLSFTANPAAVVRGGRIYLRARVGGQSAMGEVSARYTSVVAHILSGAHTPTSYADLVQLVVGSRPDATEDRVDAVIAGLCAQAFLLSDLRPPLTAGDPGEHVLRRLEAIPEAAQDCEELRAIVETATAWRDRSAGGGAGYRAAVSRARGSVPAVANPFHVDSALPLHAAEVSSAVAAEATRAAELLVRLSPFPHGPPSLTAYRDAFAARYGTCRDVPLLELLDPERGLGPLESFRETPANPSLSNHNATRDGVLLDLAVRAMHARQHSVELDQPTIDRLSGIPTMPASMPSSLDIAVFVAARSPEAIDAGDFRVIIGPNLGAPSAGRNTGRFAGLLGRDATALLGDAARVQQAAAPDSIVAELVYAPELPRAANVAVRPTAHSHEIVVGATAGVDQDRVIRCGDLRVGIRDGRLAVHWTAGDVRVTVTESHMLNPDAAPAPVRFLADVARDATAQFVAFDWGTAERLPVLPRVCAGRIVLRPAQWRLSRATCEEWAGILAGSADPVAHYRETWGIPRFVHIGYGDNRLLLDLESPAHIAELADEVRQLGEGGSIVLQEALPAPEDCWLRGPDGRYVAELAVGVALIRPTATTTHRQAARPRAARAAAVAASDDATRLRPPGSEWLYAKFYGPPSTENALLIGEIGPRADRWRDANWIDHLFFIRYDDDGPHVRLRILGAPGMLVKHVLPEICDWGGRLVADGRCSRFSLDTYDREIERFGGSRALQVVEAIFAADSRAAIVMLDVLSRRETTLDPELATILSVDVLLTSLGLDDRAKLAWLGDRVARRDRDAVGGEYRRLKTTLRSLLTNPSSGDAPCGSGEIASAMHVRSTSIAPLAASLPSLIEKASAAPSMSDIIGSLVHLHCNRLLRTDEATERRMLALLLRTRDGLARS